MLDENWILFGYKIKRDTGYIFIISAIIVKYTHLDIISELNLGNRRLCVFTVIAQVGGGCDEK